MGNFSAVTWIVIGLVVAGPAFWFGLLSYRKVIAAHRSRKLGPRWRFKRTSRGRELWRLLSESGKTVDLVESSVNGRWSTRWGREFNDLIEAARWVEAQHQNAGER